MEAHDPPKYLTLPGCHCHPLPAHLRLDARWGLARVHQKEPKRGSTSTCRHSLLYSFHTHSRSQVSDIANGLSYLHSWNVIHGDLNGVCSRPSPNFATLLTPLPAKCPHGQLWQCTHRRFWSRWCRSGLRSHAKCSMSVRSCCAMDCAGALA